MVSARAAALLASPRLAGKTRIALLKELAALTEEQWVADLEAAAAALRAGPAPPAPGADGAAPELAAALVALGGGPEAERQLRTAALEQRFPGGLPEYGPTFHAVLSACTARQRLQRDCVVAALSSLPHGFDALDRALIVHAALISSAYDAYHRAWLRAVQGNELAVELAAADRAGTLPPELYNHYTIIVKNEDGSLGQVPYAAYFPEEIGTVLRELDNAVAVLTDVDTDHTAVKQEACLAETAVERLEDAWRQLDVLWMAIRHPIQLVHDIEYGYVDPLRCKVQPEFSLRILDEAYSQQHRSIGEIQKVMVEYFAGRPGRLAQEGLAGLHRSSAGLFYLPFLAGVSLHFRFAGQSIPNRTEVRKDWGVKVYFDPVSSEARTAAAKELALQVLADTDRAEALNSLDQIVYLVAPHEIGHAIYSLDALREVIKPASKTLLEEPRAELTALHTLRLLLRGGHLARPQVECLLCCFMLSDLRRFAAWDSSATRPYTVSAMSCWARAEALGYVTLTTDGRIAMHDSKVPAFLDESSRLFEQILAAEDAMDGPAVEAILAQLEACECSTIVQHLVARLNKPLTSA